MVQFTLVFIALKDRGHETTIEISMIRWLIFHIPQWRRKYVLSTACSFVGSIWRNSNGICTILTNPHELSLKPYPKVNFK